MTYDQIIEELKRLKAHNNIIPAAEQEEIDANVNAEVEQINDTIEDYNEKILALEAKIADESNYQYNNENEERDLTIEILEESFENQLEVMAREDEEYKTLQDLATSIFTDYNLEIATLNNDIDIIERRLRKNDIAVRKNIGIRLTDEELFALNSDLEQKRARIQECEEMKAKYVEDLSNYGELITANNRKREIVLAKQESLVKIKEHRDSKVGTINNAKLRIDKDELASLKAGVAALESRKEYITYNPNAEIDKLIEAIEQNKIQSNETIEENKELDFGVFDPVIDEVKTQTEVQSDEVLKNNVEETTEDKSQTLINAYLGDNDDLLEEPEKTEEALGIPEETTAHDMWLAGNPDLDLEREAEIEEAAEILKEKKKEGWFKRNWKKWVAAGVAAIALLTALKSCDSKTNQVKPKEYSSNNTSQVQTDEGITEDKEKEFNDKYEIPEANGLSNNKITVDNNIVDNNIVQEDTGENLENDDNDLTNDEVLENDDNDLTNDDNLNTGEDLENEVQPEVDLDNQKGKAVLESGEAITSIQNILNGTINEDTVIEHGDEVGKTIDNAELNDYTEDGKAVVEFEKEQEQQEQQATTPSREDIIKNLEEFMGGDITFTDEGNKWLDQVSGKTR